MSETAIAGTAAATWSLTDEGFGDFDIEELSVFDVSSAVALPEMGASHGGWFCCSSSSSSSCCA